MNPSLKMWKNRFVRMRDAWNEGSTESTPLMISGLKASLCIACLYLMWLTYYSFKMVNAETTLSDSEILAGARNAWWIAPAFISCFVIGWLVSRQYRIQPVINQYGSRCNKVQEVISDHNNSWIIISIIMFTIGTIIGAIVLDVTFSNRPVGARSWQVYKTATAGCDRLEAWKSHRLSRREIFTHSDARRAIRDCNDEAVLKIQQQLK